MKKNMSHLVLTAEIKTVDPEVGGSDVEEDEEVVDEQRPLLRNEERNCQRQDVSIATIFSLVPDASLPAQVKRHDAARCLCFHTEEIYIRA